MATRDSSGAHRLGVFAGSRSNEKGRCRTTMVTAIRPELTYSPCQMSDSCFAVTGPSGKRDGEGHLPSREPSLRAHSGLGGWSVQWLVCSVSRRSKASA